MKKNESPRQRVSCTRNPMEEPDENNPTLAEALQKLHLEKKHTPEELSKLKEQITSSSNQTSWDAFRRIASTTGLPANLKEEEKREMTCKGGVAIYPHNFPREYREPLEKEILIPIETQHLTFILKENEDIIQHILLYYPLLPIPIYTPKLFLLLTGQIYPPTIDSFSILRFYEIVLVFLQKADITRSCKKIAIFWFKKALKRGTLTLDDLTKFEQNTSFRIPSTLSEKFKEKKLESKHLDEHKKQILRINKNNYECEWKEDVEYMEDVIDDYEKKKAEITEKMYKILKPIENVFPSPEDETMNIIQKFTYKYILALEMTICKLYQEASLYPCLVPALREEIVVVAKFPTANEMHETTKSMCDTTTKDVNALRMKIFKFSAQPQSCYSKKKKIIPKKEIPSSSVFSEYFTFIEITRRKYESPNK